ncbi:unnamed protein product [Arabidopsis halleri]
MKVEDKSCWWWKQERIWWAREKRAVEKEMKSCANRNPLCIKVRISFAVYKGKNVFYMCHNVQQ